MQRRDFIRGSAAGFAGLALPGRAEAGKTVPPHRWIDAGLCIGCRQCVPLCPVGAITLEAFSSIDPDECTECGVCWRSGVCPVDAIKPGELTWPRTLRAVFSNPLAEHEDTGVAGRGTEGIKTNDSTGRYEPGFMGVFVELGRPCLGARFREAETVTRKFAKHGYQVVSDNPVAGLVKDPATGELDPRVLDEKCISILVEFIIAQSDAERLMSILDELGNELGTVFNVSVALPADADGDTPLKEVLGEDVRSLPNGKVNIGLASGIKTDGPKG
ncbi:MAG: 4Fe-4S binding protein [bacterium]